MTKKTLLIAIGVSLLLTTSPLFAADPSPSPGMNKSMMMSEMMKDKDMMRQMCAQMANDPDMMKMMCEEMMKNPEGMKTMCREMMKDDKARAMCMDMMGQPQKKP